jgi:hypothetical protein
MVVAVGVESVLSWSDIVFWLVQHSQQQTL